MRILLVSEGKHELGDTRWKAVSSSLELLTAKILGHASDFVHKKFSDAEVRTHTEKGIGARLSKRASAWVQFARTKSFDAVVVVVDSDGDDTRIAAFESVQRNTKPELPRALGIAVREFDAWMLADERALSKALNYTIQPQPSPEDEKDPKSKCRQLLEKCKESLSQTEMYAKVAEAADPQHIANRCPKGFKPFADRVRALAEHFGSATSRRTS